MKHPWLPYIVVVIVSAVAGAAIAGLPGNEPVDATVVAPEPTPAPETTAAATTVPAVTTAPPATDPPVSTTTEAPTTTTTAPDLPDRSSLSVVVANGAGIPDIASATADVLEFVFGYVDVGATDGSEVVDSTIIYYAAGLERSASRLAADLSLAPTAIESIDSAPAVDIDLSDVDLLAYLGVGQG